MKTQSPSAEALRARHQHAEQQAFEQYAQALRAWEQLRDRADDLACQVAEAVAQWQAKTVAGCPAGELDNLRKLCGELQEREREYCRRAIRARSEASRCFTALVRARHARAEFEQSIQGESFDDSNVLILAPAFGRQLTPAHWN